MCQFADAGRALLPMLRRPLVWLALAAWGVLTALVYFMTPITPLERFHSPPSAYDLTNVRICEKVVIGSSADGAIFATATERFGIVGGWGGGPYYHGPIQVWDIRSSQLLGEIGAENDLFYQVKLAPDGSWVSFPKGNDVAIYHIETGKQWILQRSYRELCFSHSGKWIAFWESDWIQFYDSQQNTSWVWDSNVIEGLKPLRFRELHGFSEDDRHLIVYVSSPNGERFLVYLDMNDGSRVAQIAIPKDVTDIKIARDRRSLAYYADQKLIVRDADTGKTLLELPGRYLVGWDAAQKHVLVHRDKPARLETWSLETKERVADWHIPEASKGPLSRYWSLHMADGKSVLSPDGDRVLWISFHHEDIVTTPWLMKMRTWLNWPEPSGCYYDVQVLRTKTLTVEHRWQIPCSVHAHMNVAPKFEWKPMENRLFVSNHTQTEIWQVPPRSLGQSAGIAFMLIWLLGLGCYGVHTWRKRRRIIIAPTPPPAKVPEVADAKT